MWPDGHWPAGYWPAGMWPAAVQPAEPLIVTASGAARDGTAASAFAGAPAAAAGDGARIKGGLA